ncbi:hypothetical protein C7S18_11235 [Ahniella affigens]|uniref:SMP-30/Gluconolactonase/LRE-like region domain-containing protein n=1 Tax=Ahniella affigens TaxID=2021234 RepID=A0A2P1PSC0_9GAMM|nr:WD40 repeat domain-containing protein [Ahniella affigens]AVP97737.1 hypothetical protein C7S18_11235 [Ahniella affigens]
MKTLLKSGALLLSLLSGLVSAQALTPQQQRQMKQVEQPSELAKELARVMDVNVLIGAAQQYESKSEWRNLQDVYERLVQLRPHAGTIKYELAAVYALQDEKRKAYDALINLQVQGYAYDPREDKRFEKVASTPVYEYILKNLDANRAPFGEGKVAMTLPAGDHLYESLAFDPTRKQFLVGSVRDGSISLADDTGKLTPFISATKENGLWSVTDLAVDAPRNALWVASTGLPHLKGIADTDFGKAGLFKFDLKTGALIGTYLLDAKAGPFILSALAVSSKGDVFVADDAGRRIFNIVDGKLNLYVSNPRLTSIRAMTFSPNGEVLYFADYDIGIFAIRLSDQKAIPLTPSKNLTMLGIQSMTEWNGDLIIVQNAFPPARIMRLKLRDDGAAVVQAVPVAAGRPEFTSLSQTATAGSDVYVISNSQKDQYDQYGIPRDVSKLEPVKIFKANLDVTIDPRGGQVRPLGG